MGTFRVYQGVDLLHGISLPSSGSPHTADSDIEVREGGSAITVNLRTLLNELSSYQLDVWADLNPAVTTVDITLEYVDSGGTVWTALGNTATYDVVLNDFTISSGSAVSAGTFTIALDSGTIAANQLDKFRLNILITDTEG